MNSLRVMRGAALGLALTASLLSTPGEAAEERETATKPPVLRSGDAPETRVVKLPGAPAARPADPVGQAVSPVLPSKQAEPPASPSTLLPEFEKESALFCQREIGRWTEADARTVLGEPKNQRPAYAPDGVEDGEIFSYSDPSGRHMSLELDFDGKTGLLRTVFVYPWDMSWADCRRLWGFNVSAAKANKGRMFYSYLDRRLDVLVDSDGKVVSLGLY